MTTRQHVLFSGFWLALTLALACAAPAPPASAPRAARPLPEVDWPAHGLDRDGCFLLRDVASGEERVSDRARCARARRPNSTFKIANALIGLDLGLLEGPESIMVWDAARYPRQGFWIEAWGHDQSLRDAMAVSALPLFRKLAADIGPERMAAYLARLDYGNRDMSGGPDAFWIQGGMRITAYQQAEFVAKLATGRLPLSSRAQEATREVLRLPDIAGAPRFGKTGSGTIEDAPDGADDAPFFGWMVGWLEAEGRTIAYAMWVEAPSFEDMRALRTRTVEGVLTDVVAALR